LKFLDSLRIPKDFTGYKRPPPTTILTDGRQFSKYQKATVEDHPMENRTGYTPPPSSPARDFMPERSTTRAPEPPTPGPSNTIPTVNKKPAPTVQISLPNFNRFDYRSFSLAKSTHSESEDSHSDANSQVSGRFHTRSGHVVHLPREWWKVDQTPEKDVQMDGFKKPSEVEPNAPVPMMDDETTMFSKSDAYGYVVDAVDKEEPKSYLEAVNGPNGNLWKEAVEKELGSLDKARTCDIVDRVAGK
jgi:hypothetical protein